MHPELVARLRLVMQGNSTTKTGVAGVTGVARYARKGPELRQLRPLRLEKGKAGKDVVAGVIGGVIAPNGPDEVEVDERAALAADSVPAVYLKGWARLQCQKPRDVSDEQWRLAVNDAGLFLDRWGSEAAKAGWTAGDLFDTAAGLVWFIGGATVEAFGSDHARLSDGGRFEWGRGSA